MRDPIWVDDVNDSPSTWNPLPRLSQPVSTDNSLNRRYLTGTPGRLGLNNVKSTPVPNTKWQRVVFKISGAALAGNGSQSVDPKAIERRISVFSQIPVENGELIQVLRYEKDQYYRPHHDYFSDTFNVKRGGQRVATMLMFLTDNVEGGETYFPMAGSAQCSCGKKTVTGISVKPIKENAVLFWSMGLDGKSDPSSVHGGCEVLGPEFGWRPVSITDLITSSQVKIAYKKAALCIHPDKAQQSGTNLEQEKAFDLLKEAWNKFSTEELR